MIQGTLRDVPLTDVFQILVTSQKSGILTVVRESRRARIYFDMGRVQYAHISSGIHLGEILVRMDLLTSHEVQEILLKQTMENAGTPLGLMALHFGMIEQEDLQDALKAQVTEVLTELLIWRAGNFNFTERSADASQVPTEHNFDAMVLLMEVVNRIEEWKQGKVEPDDVYERFGDPTQHDLPDGSWEILGYIDGQRSAASIASLVDMPEVQVYRIMFEMLDRTVIRPSPFNLDDPLVLVISQSSALRRIIKLLLRRSRLRVEVASDADSGMMFLHENYPSALVVDDEDEEGWDFVRDLRKLPGQGHLPVLLLTTEEIEQGLFSRFRRPKAQTMQKPFEELEFQQAVTKMVGRTAT